MRFNNQNRIARSQIIRMATFLGFVVLFVIAGVPKARTQSTPTQYVWNKNQNFQCGPSSSATITSNYETNQSCNKTLCPGTPIHIVYGISDPAGSSNPVTVTIALPPTTAFTVTKVQALRFSSGTLSSTQYPTAAALVSGYSIGALAISTDHVIIVIDGYFTQAAVYSVSFTASRSGVTDETSSLTMDAQCKSPPVNLSISKTASPSSVAFGSSVTYTLTIKNTATPQTDHSTDLYLGSLLQVSDSLSVSGNDVPVDFTASPPNCTATSGAACMSMPTNPISASLPAYSIPPPLPLWTFGYPTTGTGSDGYLPAGGSFSITFNVLIKKTSTCSVSGNNNLTNSAFITFSGGFSDSIGTDNSSSVPVSLTGLPTTPCPTPAPTPGISVTKVLVSPTGTGIVWGVPFTYLITITNTTNTVINLGTNTIIPQTLTGLGLNDYVGGLGTPPFTAGIPTNIVCTPACGAFTPTATAPLVTTQSALLFKAAFAPLAPGGVQTIKYTTEYDAPPCAEVSASGAIRNYATLTGPATGSVVVDTPMPDLPICKLDVVKTQTSGPTSFASFPQTLGYHVQFKNTSTQTITVGTLIDAMAIDSAAYGDVPIEYSYTCSASPNVTPVAPLTKVLTPEVIKYHNPLWGGKKLIDIESSPGAVFPPGGAVDCDLTVKLKQPSTTDSLCQGAGKPQLTNSAFMALAPGYYTDYPTQPRYYQQVTTPLPYCISIILRKAAPATAYPGGPVTFTLTVQNTGSDPVSNIVLQDNVAPGFNPASWNWSCVSGCTGGGPGNLNVTISPPLAAGATATVKITATAPDVLGAYCNNASATVSPFPALTYFEGDDPDALTKAQACIQVVPPSGTPSPTPTPTDQTPTPSPTATATAVVTVTPTPMPGCAQVTGEARCLPNGGYSYMFSVTNNSGKPMSQILLTPVQGSTFTLTPQLTNLPTPLQNGQSTTVMTYIGNVKAGDKVCFFVSLMSDKAACCIIQVCPTLPTCGVIETATPPPPARQQRPPPPSRRGKRRP